MIVLCDVETTGLDPRKGCLLEVALLVVSDDLEPLDEGISTLVRPVGSEALVPPGKESLVTAMVDGLPIPLDVERLHPRVREMHLVNRLFFDLAHAQAEEKLPRLHAAQALLCDYVDRHCITIDSVPALRSTGEPYGRDRWPLAGNSIHFDRAWLAEHMPLLCDRFSHRNIDASTIYELCKRWRPAAVHAKGKDAHRAMPDVLESLERLRAYRRELFSAGKAYHYNDQTNDEPQPLTCRQSIYRAIDAERLWQQAKQGDKSIAGNVSDLLRLAIVTEEVGEVAKALIDDEGFDRVRAELVQVAACAVGWLEALYIEEQMQLTAGQGPTLPKPRRRNG